jgi:uncharacterized RDD family membrane protein YckC
MGHAGVKGERAVTVDSSTCVMCGGDTESRRQPYYDAVACLRCSRRATSRRTWAFIVDFNLAFGLGSAATLAVPSGNVELMALVAFVVGAGLFVLRDAVRGISPGKLLLGLRVVDSSTGLPIGVTQSLRRNGLLALPLFPILAAFLVWKGPHLGDLHAGTRVTPRGSWGTRGAPLS